jgi:hypothetical protein
MKNINQKTITFSIISIVFAIIPLLMTGCQSVNSMLPSSQEPQEISVDHELIEGQDFIDSFEPTISLDLGTVAQDTQVEIIPAVSPDSNAPYWEILPKYQVFSLEGYEISEHLLKAQIFLYPVAELAAFNQEAEQIASNLEILLDSQIVGESLPFLPLINAAQVMHSKVAFLDFESGSGVRFLTQFDQAPLPINNFELIYTFQGLTDDGKYYVSAVFPITHPNLADDSMVDSSQEFDPEAFSAQMAESVIKLGNFSDQDFSPTLSQLDEVIRSISVE